MQIIDFVTFGVILDDIIFPDGRAEMKVLGGGGPQTAFGIRLWSPSVGLSAGVGEADESDVRNWLRQSGIDDSGLRLSSLQTPRAWQLMEADGRRTQVWRLPVQEVFAQLDRSIQYLPESYRQARGFHFGIHPDEPDLDFITELRLLGGVVSIEPFKPADRLPGAEKLSDLLSLVDIFSCNQEEARSLTGLSDPNEQLEQLITFGAQVAVVRMGERGSLIRGGRNRAGMWVPAAMSTVVDPVGAGNAYCGGFLAGWVETGDLHRAGLYGSVAASFLLEQVGVPVCTDRRREEARRRLQALEKQLPA